MSNSPVTGKNRLITAATAFSASALLVLASALPASAAPVVIYDSMPNPLASNYPSLGYEATQTAEFGDQVSLGGTNREVSSISILMSSWACEVGSWTGNPGVCTTTPGATFNHDITLNIFNVNTVDPTIPGTLIKSVTKNAAIPFRPSADPTNCGGGSSAWFDGTSCFNGFAFTLTWDLSSFNLTLPDDVIVSVAYNTRNYGASPEGGAEGPYDSLNVALSTVAPTVGTEDATRVFWNTTFAGSGGDGTLKEIVNSPELDGQPPYGGLYMTINSDAALASTGIDSQALVTGAGIAGTLLVIGLALAVLAASRRRRAAISERG
ncbi:MAG: hypothetical protein IT192_04185 [Microbacteriaceae bacterium]|nr:hypothetical protein [Microbacteriaceae bacterium]